MPRLSLNKTSSRDQFFDIARGLRPDCTAVDLFGFNRTVGLTFETIFNDGGGVYTFPASALQMSLVSSSASDTMQVLLTGLDADRAELTELVTLTGTTPVTTTNSFLRINGAQITSGSNVGNITISNSGTTYAYIEAGYGVHQAAIYSTPANRSLYITQVEFTSGTLNENKYITARAGLYGPSDLTMHFFETTFVTSQLSYKLRKPFKVPAGYDFSLEAKSSAQENALSAYISAVLMDD